MTHIRPAADLTKTWFTEQPSWHRRSVALRSALGWRSTGQTTTSMRRWAASLQVCRSMIHFVAPCCDGLLVVRGGKYPANCSQVIDDLAGHTLASCNTLSKELFPDPETRNGGTKVRVTLHLPGDNFNMLGSDVVSCPLSLLIQISLRHEGYARVMSQGIRRRTFFLVCL